MTQTICYVCCLQLTLSNQINQSESLLTNVTNIEQIKTNINYYKCGIIFANVPSP